MSVTRINPETGIIEKDNSAFGGAFGYDFLPAGNENGRVERVNTDTGILEEDQSAFKGTFGYDFLPKG